ncbi:MAG: LysR family transcriptional regulator, partial [Treponema sp.]|nr:LysR family transcriptional regulator [Treponema sp.]
MTDKQLRYILTVAEEGNITRAAGKLNITQPSLSALISNIEEELGLKLFNRDDAMSLTYGGECYVEAARKTLSIQYELQNRIKDIKNEDEGRLSIGCSQQISAQILPEVIPVFYKKHPKCQLRLLEANVNTLEKLLLSDNLDMAFAGGAIPPNDMLEHITLYDEEIILLTPKKYIPVSRKKERGHFFPVCDPSDMSGKPFALFERGRPMRSMADRIFADFNITPQVFFETNNWQTCYRMVEENMAFTFLPNTFIPGYEESNKMKRFSLPGSYVRYISLYFKKRSYQAKLLR